MLWRPTFVGSCLRWCYAKTWKTIAIIPDHATLWRAIKPDFIYKKTGKIKPTYFRDKRGGFSCDIALFSSREKSRIGYRHPPAWPPGAGLVEFKAYSVRNAGCDIVHVPLRDSMTLNYSHAQFTAVLSDDGVNSMISDTSVVIAPK
jgi:hypothetical protein